MGTLSGCIGSGVKSDFGHGTFGLLTMCTQSLNDKQGSARFLPGLKTGASARDRGRSA